ncbi:hypothetical protein PV773_06250 [Mesorhizobium sp. CC13]|jgi:hypothetical protein|uniref:hypothetical protein n=1 Tax=Mesorhizobium sp. CC13 TaxID=3029194 RepID=UPI003265C2A1
MMQLIGSTVASDNLLKEHAALPWRMSGDGTLEVLLLSPRRDGSWRIPAARCSGTRTGIQSADRAAFQDAGVTGRVGSDPLGRYITLRLAPDGSRKAVEVTVHGLHVWGSLVSWPNDVKVTRRWMPPAEAAFAVEDTGLRDLFRSLVSGAAPVRPDLPTGRPLVAVPTERVSGLASSAATGRFAPC